MLIIDSLKNQRLDKQLRVYKEKECWQHYTVMAENQVNNEKRWTCSTGIVARLLFMAKRTTTSHSSQFWYARGQ